MDQILHIFRKDVRRFWWEIAVSLAVLATFAWNEPKEWTGGFDPDVRLWLSLLTPLVPIAWIFLILRVVQDESLVGDRQFWVTRPYQWPKLLAEKILFILVFVNVPIFLAQVFLLAKAGFHPASYLPGLFSLQVMWLLLLVLPAMVFAVVTSSIGQVVLAVFAAILYLIAFTTVTSSIRNPGLWRAEEVPRSLIFAMVLAAGIAVILRQYARRRTGWSRALLFTVAGAALVVVIITPYQMLIARTYPQTTSVQQAPVQLVFDLTKPDSQQAGRFSEKDKVWVQIPLNITGIAPDSEVDVDGTMATIQAAGGLQWSSPWHPLGGRLMPARQHFQESFAVDRSFFERVKSTPAKIRMSFALTVVHQGEATRIIPTAGEFLIPGNGRCSIHPLADQFQCLFPLVEPYMLMSARSEDITCPVQDKETPLPPGLTGYGWVGQHDSGNADFGLSPVQTPTLFLWDWEAPRTMSTRICPGTPVQFSRLKETEHTGTELTIEGIRLADYELKSAWRGDGITVRSITVH